MSTLQTTSRGQACFASGKKYQAATCARLNQLTVDNKKCVAIEITGADAGPDIDVTSHVDAKFEVKNKGAFEGGCVKMTYDTLTQRLVIPTAGIHKALLGDTLIYEGLNLPWYEGKRTLADWNAVKKLFGKDIYITAHDHAVAEYYRHGGVAYIQIEKKGLYHTGIDSLMLGVPYFSCPNTCLRIRSTKHKRKDGICTDVTAAFQYNRRKLITSPYTLDADGILPPAMTLTEAVVAE